MVYVRMIVRGQVPLSVSVKVKEDSSSAQLSDALPPPLINSVNVVKAGGMSPAHSRTRLDGQEITGGS